MFPMTVDKRLCFHLTKAPQLLTRISRQILGKSDESQIHDSENGSALFVMNRDTYSSKYMTPKFDISLSQKPRSLFPQKETSRTVKRENHVTMFIN